MSKQSTIITTLKTTDGDWHIELEVYYSKGGVNFLSVNSYRRGYYAGAQPVQLKDGCRSFQIGGNKGGIKDLIEEAKMFNAKRLANHAANASSLAYIGRCLRGVLAKSGLTLTEEAAKEAKLYLEAADIATRVLPPTPPPTPTQPYTIRTIVQQMGGRGLTGAFVYVGASPGMTYKCPPGEHETRSGYRSKEVDGKVDFDVGIHFSVNGKKGEAWNMVVAYEPDDTYTVWLASSKGIIDHVSDVYCDELKHVVESMYDRAIKARNEGFIPA